MAPGSLHYPGEVAAVKTWKLVLPLVLVLAGAVGGIYLSQMSPIGIVVEHERRLRETEGRAAALESRATTAEQKLADHEKRIGVLEKTVEAEAAELSVVHQDLEKTRKDLTAGQERLAELDKKVDVGAQERVRLDEEVQRLRAKVDALEKDLVKRIEVLEKLTDAKAQR
jgi:chromosome segregation ATPase